MKLVWETDELDLPELDPPASLRQMAAATAKVHGLITSRRMERSTKGYRDWIQGGASQSEIARRQRDIDDVMRFLQILEQPRLEHATEAYQAHYQKYLTTDPAARAALFIARGVLAREQQVRWEGVPVAIRPCLPG